MSRRACTNDCHSDTDGAMAHMPLMMSTGSRHKLQACCFLHDRPALHAIQAPKLMHDSAVDIVKLNSNGKMTANDGEASQSALPFSQLYMTFDHGAVADSCMLWYNVVLCTSTSHDACLA